ncbi:putative quinol monooxygenase [Sphingopyxis sp. JAI128]|uniref:putative quinol monooxygenase n=1 Tax=Sphingopyxis sp. JAI128 TaxID=2723066 RepID=UPI001610100B|nr:antibiotic biosynthesis monooxygenase [Sphingopyxis sp. JAI128]MBB6425909.1 quinol monooxygenase YgiN [Sphingopyxis sp. JAI128]
MNRRTHLAAMLAMAAALLPATKLRALEAKMEVTDPQYGLLGQMMARPGQRAERVAILSDPDAIWIVKLWDSKAAHAASLKLPAVQTAIAKGRPLIAGFGTRAEFRPVAKTGR